jgi:hypothetical protein
LDFASARYLSSAQGRFTGPDEPLMDQWEEAPQSWNLFSNVRNNPLKFVDPSGEDCIYTGNFGFTGNIGFSRGDNCSNGGIYVPGNGG